MADEIELLRLVGNAIPGPSTDAWARARAAVAAARAEEEPAGPLPRRTLGRRWIVPVAAGVLVVAAGAVLAMTTLVLSSHRGSHQTTVRLAAWTVTKRANGSIDVTVRQWRDPARLQATLRADGVPAVVTPPPNPACRPYPASRGLLAAIVRFQPPAQGRDSHIVLVIHPSAIPSGAGLSISIAQAMQQPPGAKPVPRAVPPVPVGGAGGHPRRRRVGEDHRADLGRQRLRSDLHDQDL